MPTGVTAAPTFSANSTNAAKNTTATFYAAGTYTFHVTMTDPVGLSSDPSPVQLVSVYVAQTLTSVVVSPNSVRAAPCRHAAVRGPGADQFGAAPNNPLPFTWSTTVGTINSSPACSPPAPARRAAS